MWKLAICSPRRSSGETSATKMHASPPPHAAARQPPAALAPPSAREVRQRRP